MRPRGRPRRSRARHRSQRNSTVCLLGLAVAAAPTTVPAQENETPQNLIGWLKYHGTHPIGERAGWALRAEAEIKRNHLVADPVSLKGRIGIERTASVRVAIGYYFTWHSPYDGASQPYSFPEQGAWEEVTFHHHLGSGQKTELSHRLRMEQRWLARRDSAGAPIDRWKFENVLAYRVQLSFGDGIAPVISEEVWLRAPPRSGDKFLDENRIAVGIRVPFGNSSHWRLDLAYVHQAVFRSPRTVSGRERVNHNIRLTLISSVPLR